MRFAYLKNGDAVDQVSRLVPLGQEVPTSGPDAFIGDFLKTYADTPVLVMSRGNTNAEHKEGEVQARVFRKGDRILSMMLLKPWVAVKILYYLMRFHPDRILCGSTGSVLWTSYLVSRLLSVPYVHSRHNRVSVDGAGWLKRIRAKVDAYVVRNANAVVCHGPFLRQQLEEVGVSPERVYEFDVSFDASIYKKADSAPEIAGFSSSDKVLLYVGRMENSKGVFDLLNACREFFTKNESLKLVYVGSGAAVPALKQVIEEDLLGNKVKLLGHVEHDRLLTMIQASYGLISPTRSQFPEGRCMAAMEGLVMGVPVIAPDFGPFPYLVKHGRNGLLYEPDSVSELRSAIGRILQDGAMYDQLRQGALESGRQILEPSLTFAQAVAKAFEPAVSSEESHAS